MSANRLQLEQELRQAEAELRLVREGELRAAEAERLTLRDPLPPARPVLRPLDLRGPFDQAADRVQTWWRMRKGDERKQVSRLAIQNLVRELRAMGKAK